jgi:hypothetical protein
MLDQEVASAGSRAQKLDHFLVRRWIDAAALRRGAHTRGLAILFSRLFGHRPIFYPVATGRAGRALPAPEAPVEAA